MRDDKANSDERELAMGVTDEVVAPRPGDVAKARCKAELKAHHCEVDITERAGELGPEIREGGHDSSMSEKRGPKMKSR